MKAWIIWAPQRSGGTALYNALCQVAPLWAESEPFSHRWPFVKDLAPDERDAELSRICGKHVLMKHLYDVLPLEFNIALAKEATRRGYHHIRLVRDEDARLLSLGIARQSGAWVKSEMAEAGIKALLDNNVPLRPLDVNGLLRESREAREQWRQIARHLRDPLYVKSEELFDERQTARQLLRIASFLWMSTQWLHKVSKRLHLEDQDTSRLARLIPNVAELRHAVAEEERRYGQDAWSVANA